MGSLPGCRQGQQSSPQLEGRYALQQLTGLLPQTFGGGRAFLDQRADRTAEAVRDVFWALLCSAEFLTMPR